MPSTERTRRRFKAKTRKPAAAPERPEPGRGTPVLVNLLLGIPGLLPLYLAIKSATTYSGCGSLAAQTANTTPGCPDTGTGFVMWCGAAVLGGMMLLAILTANIFVPIAYRWRIRRWLAASLVLPAPQAVIGTICLWKAS
ncbi:hypothetical protein AB0933_17435 [Streptomyces venezuelae]|uniref:hypothetical protein n=1 Tax=Streptomyces venezuelae TaxID=54571 RepID=UPI003454F3B7